MKFKKPSSELANTYIEAHYGQSPDPTRVQVKVSLKKFHRWLESEQLTFLDLDRVRFIQFDKMLIENGLERSTRTNIRRWLQKYFVWLYKKMF